MFCNTVWNGLHILPDGYIRLCSLGSNSDPALDMQRCRDEHGNVMHILTHSIKDIMNSDKHREVRLFNINNPTHWSPHCDCCENRERMVDFNRNHPNKSRRIYLMKIENDITEDNHIDTIDEQGRIDWMPSSLDIRFGNLCNQKCIMCSPVFSNMWYDEYFQYYPDLKFGQGKPINIVKNIDSGKWTMPQELQWFEDPRWWVKFEEMAPFLKHIYITGGEPMVAPAHDIMLDKLIELGYAKNIWLEYDTNASAINDKIAQRWKNFKKVDIRVSMDSTKAEYELIRFPGNWDTFTKNVMRLKEYELSSNGIITISRLTACFQLATAFSIIESEEWCKSIGLAFHIRFLEGPAHHSVDSLSDGAKLSLINFYSPHAETSSKAKMIISYLKNQLGKDFHKPDAIVEFSKFMDYLDSTRNTTWRQTLTGVEALVQLESDHTC